MLPFIFDTTHAVPVSAYPRSIGRVALKRPYTWHFSTQGLPSRYVTTPERGLLPHIFTLTLYSLRHTRRLFSVALSVLSSLLAEKRQPHPLGGALLYAVRTFLIQPKLEAVARFVVSANVIENLTCGLMRGISF
jgi:hypothetical protein